MKNILYIFVIMLLVSCSNWQYKIMTYDRCVSIDRIHVHFYHHETCEWSCLDLETGEYYYKDSVRIKYKINKECEINKVKLIK